MSNADLPDNNKITEDDKLKLTGGICSAKSLCGFLALV